MVGAAAARRDFVAISSGAMTVKERASGFLLANPNRDLCDKCLAKALGVHASTGHRAAVKVARSGKFRRAYGRCSDCGETRFVTRALEGQQGLAGLERVLHAA